ncbi:uncharacterized protein LOC106012302 [Aplysia californica]|uniref:Uncharacterized protein LOC106012302 n=1 Tax=Aplysia californica TaxID=6500 RepID=A0ABM1A3X4_APLCA|nr:uncharacterized protein LOC106012302 [Aplysia californica]
MPPKKKMGPPVQSTEKKEKKKKMPGPPAPPPHPPDLVSEGSVVSEAASDVSMKMKAPSKLQRPMKKAPKAVEKKLPFQKALMQQFEAAQNTTEELAVEYEGGQRASLLSEIRSFNKKSLNDAEADDPYLSEVSNMTETDEDEEMMNIQRPKIPKGPRTLDQKMLCFNYWDGGSYPTDKVKFIVLQLDVNAEMTMNFSGIPQLTDYTFALMLTSQLE